MASKPAKSSSQFSSMNSSINSLTKSTNGPLQLPRQSKAPSKRSVTPNSRAHETDPSLKAPSKRSVTPIYRSHPNGDNDPVAASGSSGGSGGKVGSKRSVTPVLSRNDSITSHDPEPGRVRVAIRLRPRNAEDLASDADFADCVELQPEMKKVKLRKNNWSSESYKFDEVLTETASQKRVYQVVAKPVVESVLSGYNGTVMAYGQTGTGKTYTVGNLGQQDASERGMMVRAVEDIISNTSPPHDTIEVSYLQLYMESVQDLLSPEKVNIPIVEDAKTGEVSLPGVAVIELQDLDHFVELLQKGEANRHAANTKMNTNSSRSHAILMVYVRRSVSVKADAGTDAHASYVVGTIRKSKLLIVDLAGSERVGKSGSEGHLFEEAKFINLSLTSLGKCINALAENSPHIPTRESKLTRLLRDSFGGSARTSLIITIGPSARHHAETTSTIMFGQRAMKIVNMVKLKEEFDYESLSRKLESQVDHLTKEVDRQQKLRDNYRNEMEKKLKECQLSFAEAEKSLVARSEILEKENARLELQMETLLKELNQQKDCNKLLQEEVARLQISLEYYKQKENENSTHQEALAETTRLYETERTELIKQLESECSRREGSEEELRSLKKLLNDHERTIKQQEVENSTYQKALVDTSKKYEKRITELLKQLDNEHACSVHAEEQVDTFKKSLNDQKEELMKQLEDERALRAHAEEKVNLLEKMLSDQSQMQSKEQLEITELREKLKKKDEDQGEASDIRNKVEELEKSHETITSELQSSKIECADLSSEKEKISGELEAMKEKLLAEEKRRMMLENELVKMKRLGPENNKDVEEKKAHARQRMSRGSSSFRSAMGLPMSISGHSATLSQICEEVGLEKVLSLFSSDDIEVQMHAVKLVANLAAEDTNQEKIVKEGGLDALLMLLRSSENSTILRVASGAIANLAMNESNQGLIMSKGGAQLLANTASKTDDPQTLRMVAGAISNLCGNVNLHPELQQEGCIKALLTIAKGGNAEVVAQVARGLANFAKCETREVIQGKRKGRSLLMDDGALSWLIVNSNTTADSTRRHIELALCHLAQNEENSPDFVSTGGLKDVIRISSDSAREDIRNLAKKTLKLNPTFQAQLHANR